MKQLNKPHVPQHSTQPTNFKTATGLTDPVVMSLSISNKFYVRKGDRTMFCTMRAKKTKPLQRSKEVTFGAPAAPGQCSVCFI